MNVLSLFGGIETGCQAIRELGFEVGKYYSSEVDSKAITVAMDNHPDIIQLGDVTKWREWNIDWGSIDLLIGGSPCQGFSICGNRLNFDDPRSALFQEYLDILNHIRFLNPSAKFMLENVKMQQHCQDKITELLGVDPIFIDSSIHSAAMRKRLYWFNWDSTLPEKEDVKFQDILTDGYVEKDKSWCVLEAWNRFPVSTESAKGRYKRSMMPIVFCSPDFDWLKGWREPNRIETERLMCMPDNYTKAVWDKVAKGLLGNGWNLKTVKHIFKHLK